MSVRKVAGTEAVNRGVEVEFEDNVPFPGRRSEYTQDWNIEAMKVSQSFFVPLGKDQKEGSMRHALQSYCNRRGRELNRNIKFAKDTKNGKPGFRIFRFDGEYVEPQKQERTKKAA